MVSCDLVLSCWSEGNTGFVLETQRVHLGGILNFMLPKVFVTNHILGQLSFAAEKPVALPDFIIYSPSDLLPYACDTVREYK